MKLKTAIFTAIVAISNSAIAQNTLFNNQDSSESITFVEVKEEGEVKVESSNDIIHNWKEPIQKNKERLITSEIKTVPLQKVKDFCEENMALFEKDAKNQTNNESNLEYQEGESLSNYCHRYVAIFKIGIEKDGYLVENIYSKPVKQGELVDDLWISHDNGQNEGIIAYTKNDNVKVRTVNNNDYISAIPINLLPLSLNLENSNNQENSIKLEDKISMQEKNSIKLNKIVEVNRLIGKSLSVKNGDKAEIDMSHFMNLLPDNMRSFHIRVIVEGMAATLDFRDERINILIDKNNIIKMINIG